MSDQPRPHAAHDTSHAIREPRRHVLIEKNGDEYLVTINGAVFLALSLAAAEAIARRRSGHSSAYRAECAPARDIA